LFQYKKKRLKKHEKPIVYSRALFSSGHLTLESEGGIEKRCPHVVKAYCFLSNLQYWTKERIPFFKKKMEKLSGLINLNTDSE